MSRQSSADALRQAPSAPLSTPTIDAQLAHRTIRAYTEEPLSSEELETLLTVARHGATSSFMQQATLIHVTDPTVREAIAAASGQPYVGGTRGELFVVVADLYRNAQLRLRAGESLEPVERMTTFLTSVEDAMIAAQNLVVAAESLGLGTTYLGSIWGDCRGVIRALQLPRYTLPLVGLLVGHPDQEPQYKPRLPRELVVGQNTYPLMGDTDVSDYDSRVQEYYDLRDTSRRISSFSHHVSTMMGKGAAAEAPIREILTEQGLALH